jgi:hypothetical protein
MVALTHHRLRTLAACLALVLLGCHDDMVEVPEDLIGKPYCMMVVGSMVHFADSPSRIILTAEGPAPRGCGCARQEDRWSEENVTKLNDLAYSACEQTAKRYDDAVSNDCRRDYESGYWHNSIWSVGEDGKFPHLRPPDLHCVDI